jgi:hypothetical protein
MLTQKQIRKVARLMEQVGELRPGFVRDSDANLDGAVSACQPKAVVRRRKPTSKSTSGKTVSVRVVYETDVETGEERLVQK